MTVESGPGSAERTAPHLVESPAPDLEESSPRAGRTGLGLLDQPVLCARDVSMGFGHKTVLTDVDLGFAPRAIHALIGPTGCGKSTLLRSFNRLNDKVRGFWRRGVIELDGVEVSGGGVDPLVLRRRVGMVFQRPNPFPLSIRDNVV